MEKCKAGESYLCIKHVAPKADSKVIHFTAGTLYKCKIEGYLLDNFGEETPVNNGWFNETTFIREDSDRVFVSDDKVNHPSYYKHPSGIECIEIARYYDFSIGSAIKYLWRAGLKEEKGYTHKEKEIEDLKKAIWYINDRIKQLENVK